MSGCLNAMTPADLIKALSDPAAYPFVVDRVTVRQTHISVLFFAGVRVYKIKKPVDLGFLDFTTLERRRYFCEQEVRLNRRLAPDVYLGVTPILAGSDGRVRVAGGPDAANPSQTLEYAVEMRRLPPECMLDRLLDEGAIDNATLDGLVELLLRFHREAATGPGVDEHGEPEAVRRMVLANLRQSAAHVGGNGGAATLTPTLHGHLLRSAERFLAEHRPLLERRVRDGRIREGHGDLHAGNICLTPDGIVIYDCIEFSPGIRCGDVARDLAFLVMDLDYRRFRGFGGYVARKYAQAAADPEFGALLPFYKTHLAAVRGHVNSIVAGDPAADEAARAAARREAMRYYMLAASYSLPPALVLMCGLPGSGKSWMARHIDRPFEAAIVRSDVVRKRLAGIAPTHRPTGAEAEALYADRSSRRTYETMLAETTSLLGQGRSVVVDANFADADSRAPFIQLATDGDVPWVVVHLDVSEGVIARRLGERGDEPGEVSDADWAVYKKLQAHFKRPVEIPDRHLVVSDESAIEELIVADVIDRIIDQCCDDAR